MQTGGSSAPPPRPEGASSEQSAGMEARTRSLHVPVQIPMGERSELEQQQSSSSPSQLNLPGASGHRTSLPDTEGFAGGPEAPRAWHTTASQTVGSAAASNLKVAAQGQGLHGEFFAASGSTTSPHDQMDVHVSPSEAVDPFACLQQPLAEPLGGAQLRDRFGFAMCPQEDGLQYYMPSILGAMEDRSMDPDLGYFRVPE